MSMSETWLSNNTSPYRDPSTGPPWRNPPIYPQPRIPSGPSVRPIITPLISPEAIKVMERIANALEQIVEKMGEGFV